MVKVIPENEIKDDFTKAGLEKKYEECLSEYESRGDSTEETLLIFRTRFDAIKQEAQELGIKYLEMVDRVTARKKKRRESR